MPSPSSSLATLRPDIAESFTEFDLAMNESGFIWNQVMPVTDVAKSSGTFGIIPIEQLLQARDTKRAPGAGYARSGFTFTTSTFATEEHGAEEPVDDREAKLYAEYFDAELIAGMRAAHAVRLNAEIRIASAIYNTTTWNGGALTTGITHEWDDATNAVPVDDVFAARALVYDGSGIWPDTLIINYKQFLNLLKCDQIIERIESAGAGSSSRAGQITVEMLAQCFNLRKILIGGGSKNSANEGVAATPEMVWSDEYAMVCKTADTADFREPCVGRVFHWSEDGSSLNGTVETYREEAIRSDVVRVRHDVDEKVLYPQLGHLLSNVTTI
jgi:hypothetical protein